MNPCGNVRAVEMILLLIDGAGGAPRPGSGLPSRAG